MSNFLMKMQKVIFGNIQKTMMTMNLDGYSATIDFL